jgi:beta-lactamase class D
MKKFLYIICLAILAVAPKAEAKPGIDSLFKAHKLRGSFVLLDYNSDKYTIYNETRCRKRYLPASTFKIPNALIGLETGVIKDSNQTFKWDGKPQPFKTWEADLNLGEAMRASCVPYFQDLARNVGKEKMQSWIDKFNYGNKSIAGAIDRFWLDGDLKISQMEQIDFLKKFYFNLLPVKKKNIEIVKAILPTIETATYVIHGKTGTVNFEGKLYAWYVGYLVRSERVYFFALNIEDKANKEGMLVKERMDLCFDVLRYLNLTD